MLVIRYVLRPTIPVGKSFNLMHTDIHVKMTMPNKYHQCSFQIRTVFFWGGGAIVVILLQKQVCFFV